MAEILILRPSLVSLESGTPYKRATDERRQRGLSQPRRTCWVYRGKMIWWRGNPLHLARRGDPLLLCPRYIPHRRRRIGLPYQRDAKMRQRLNIKYKTPPQVSPTCGLRHHPDGGRLNRRAQRHLRRNLRELVVLSRRLKMIDSPQPKKL